MMDESRGSFTRVSGFLKILWFIFTPILEEVMEKNGRSHILEEWVATKTRTIFFQEHPLKS